VTDPPNTVSLVARTADDMRRLGVLLARRLRDGDVLIATGALGAGKTVLAQGLGAGLGVVGPVTSPTFVLARLHRPGPGSGLGFMHVDAYRLGSAAELADIDLDYHLTGNVTFIEWGEGMAEWLSDERLSVAIERRPDDERRVVLTPVGRRWDDVDWDGLRHEFEEGDA